MVWLSNETLQKHLKDLFCITYNSFKKSLPDDIKVIFAEPQFDPKSADVIADEIGGTVILIDPLSKEYTDNIRLILSEMIKAME